MPRHLITLAAALLILLLAAPSALGQVSILRSSGPIAVAVPDAGEAGSEMTLPDVGTIRDVDVAFFLEHPYSSDVEVRLVSPAGSSVRLVTGAGGSSSFAPEDLGGCPGMSSFDDQASASLPTTGPSWGTFRPLDALAAFHGQSSAGTWRLLVRDLGTSDVGTLRCWTLRVRSARLPAFSLDTTVAGHVTRIGPLAVPSRTAGPYLRNVINTFGRPTSLVRDRFNRCVGRWTRLGITAEFANYGGVASTCRPIIGLLQSLRLRTTRWSTPEGLRPGATLEQLRALYPTSRPVAGRWPLATYYTLIGDARTAASISASFTRGRVSHFDVWIGAAGD